jgi:AraC-like DNA-binding protein
MVSMYAERPTPVAAVACTWRWQTGGTAYLQRVVPDGCIDVVVSGGDAFVAGPDTRPWLAELPAGDGTVGVRLWPGAAPALLGVPADALRDARVPLSQLRRDADRVVELTWSAADPEAALLDLVVAGRSTLAPPRGLVRALCPDGAAEWPRLGQVTDILGCSERQLRRRCLALFGYGPKTLQRVLRFQRALRSARAGDQFADIAYRLGYADQAHLAHEVRELGGVPLRQLL